MGTVKKISLVCLICLIFGSATGGAEDPTINLPEWADDVQTFIMLPTRPDRANELNVSVNGACGGIPGRFAVLPYNAGIQEEYNYDEAAFADAGHEAGLIVTATVNGIEGLEALREVIPNLDDMACRNVDGEVINFGMTLMCTLNPDWVQTEIEAGETAIDAGADWILLDTPMGASFISGFLGAGHCDTCKPNFERYLKEKYNDGELEEKFGIIDYDRDAISQRLGSMQKMERMDASPLVLTTPDALLFQEFAKCQEVSNFETRKQVLDTLHEYAREMNREVIFCTNAADLGTQNPGGHWVRALMFADLVELFTYEQNNDPQGWAGSPLSRLPRGKWAAFHKLAQAVTSRRNGALLLHPH